MLLTVCRKILLFSELKFNYYIKTSNAPLAKMTKISIGDFRRIGDYLFHFMLYLMLFNDESMENVNIESN